MISSSRNTKKYKMFLNTRTYRAENMCTKNGNVGRCFKIQITYIHANIASCHGIPDKEACNAFVLS
jgi:hypothetical protein